ncbi:MAG: amino acid ABC transporter permease [Rhodobacterales bacterium]|nr:amino acid ABC transporter permease [Rhodobacterales bacterium]
MSDARTTSRAAPVVQTGPVQWAKENLFNGPVNTALTLISLYVLWLAIPPLVNWALIDAVFTPDPATCKAASGACWGFITEKYRLMLSGTYPYEQQWRPVVAMVVLLGLIGMSMNSRFWNIWLAAYWVVGIVVMGVLMWGGVLGLPYVENAKWGGLPLTLILAVNGIVFSFPLAIALALGRRSNMPAIRAVCVTFIELVRGVPLITVLFMASLMLPLFLPEGMTIDKLLRAQVGIILFTAAYEAEVIRGGLQALPRGQFEAGDSLGLSYWQKTGLIILPQALKLVIPPMVNTFISMFKDTSLVIIIGLFDLLGSVRLAANDPMWRPFYVEGLVFVAVIYFIFCYTIARYSEHVERLARKGERR